MCVCVYVCVGVHIYAGIHIGVHIWGGWRLRFSVFLNLFPFFPIIKIVYCVYVCQSACVEVIEQLWELVVSNMWKN